MEDVATLLFRRDALFVAYLLQANHFSNVAGSRVITNLEPDVRARVYYILHPEDYHTKGASEDEEEGKTEGDA